MSELQLIARHTIAVGNEDEVLPLLPIVPRLENRVLGSFDDPDDR
jgi:hypothetical protein